MEKGDSRFDIIKYLAREGYDVAHFKEKGNFGREAYDIYYAYTWFPEARIGKNHALLNKAGVKRLIDSGVLISHGQIKNHPDRRT